jgi:hypothetical protein
MTPTQQRAATPPAEKLLASNSSPNWAGTPADIFIPADVSRLRRLFEAHGVEIWAETQVFAAQGGAGASASAGSITPRVTPTIGSP